jgi:hypothetical protein
MGLMGGMISATVLAVFFKSVFFVVVMKLFGWRKTGVGSGEASVRSVPMVAE